MATVSASGDGVTINGHFGTAATEKRDGGSVVMAGNVAAGDPITVSKSNIDLGTGDDGYGAKVVANNAVSDGSTKDNTGIGTAFGGHLTSGTLAYQPTLSNPQYIIRGVLGRINNAFTFASGVVATPGSSATTAYDGIAQTNADVRLGSGVSTEINVLAKPSTNINPARTKGADAGLAFSFITPSGDGNEVSNDTAGQGARTRAADLTYMQGGKTPNRTQYKDIELAESGVA